MKMNYNSKSFSRWIKPAIVTVMALACLSTSAEVINWTGSVDDDATNPSNWTPALSIIDNDMTIDSAFNYTNFPVLNLTGENQINGFAISATGKLTINNAGDRLNVNTGANTYSRGTLILNEGLLTFRKSYYMMDSTT
ncbi:MAG: hypothetical protein PF444_08045, partial [Bacteroidales bacterium]|nr:hypothetical protein [Bacteroidales bacterium]